MKSITNFAVDVESGTECCVDFIFCTSKKYAKSSNVMLVGSHSCCGSLTVILQGVSLFIESPKQQVYLHKSCRDTKWNWLLKLHPKKKHERNARFLSPPHAQHTLESSDGVKRFTKKWIINRYSLSVCFLLVIWAQNFASSGTFVWSSELTLNLHSAWVTNSHHELSRNSATTRIHYCEWLLFFEARTCYNTQPPNKSNTTTPGKFKKQPPRIRSAQKSKV